jgi:hypothetical protein
VHKGTADFDVDDIVRRVVGTPVARRAPGRPRLPISKLTEKQRIKRAANDAQAQRIAEAAVRKALELVAKQREAKR